MTATALGGIMLILGSFFVMRGEIFKSVLVFTTADVCWVIAAFATGDWFAIFTVTLGAVFGIYALIKMHKGEMRKELKW